MVIGLVVLEISFSFFTIYGHGGHLGHVTWTIYIYINFLSPFTWRLHMNLTETDQVVSGEKSFEDCYGR